MKLIELILHNWVFFIIAFFFLRGVFKRSKGESKPPGTRPAAPNSGMPPFGGGGAGTGTGWGKKVPGLHKGKSVPAASSERQGERTSPAAPAASRTTVKPQSRQDAAVPVFKGQQQGREPEASFWDASPLEGDSIARRARKKPVNGDNGDFTDSGSMKPLSRNQLAQGVIWAEILGPPRSKKPYRKP